MKQSTNSTGIIRLRNYDEKDGHKYIRYRFTQQQLEELMNAYRRGESSYRFKEKKGAEGVVISKKDIGEMISLYNLATGFAILNKIAIGGTLTAKGKATIWKSIKRYMEDMRQTSKIKAQELASLAVIIVDAVNNNDMGALLAYYK